MKGLAARGATRRRSDESDVHAAVVAHLTMRGMPGSIFWHTPNGGARSKSEAGRFKTLGVKAGIPDLLVLRDSRLFALELKADNGRLSPHQVDMLGALERAGARTAVAVGLDAALMTLEGWGLLRPTSATSCR